MKVTAFAVSLLLAGNVLAQDNAPNDELYDFKGVRLGSSAESWEDLYLGTCEWYWNRVDIRRCSYDTTVATLGATAVYLFSAWVLDKSENGLFQINIRVENDSPVSVVRAALIDRYGPPHRKLQVNPLNPEETYTPPADSWVKGDSEIIYSGNIISNSAGYERRITRLVYVHWPLYLKNERRQAEHRANDL